MRQHNARVLLSASDLNTFLGCHHASALDYRHAILGEALTPADSDEGQKLVQRHGFEHEQRHFETLQCAAVGEVVRVGQGDVEEGRRQTESAIRRGAHLIFQGVLADHGSWHGYADFLVRTDTPSALGPWSYEVHDTKLARKLKAKFAIQLAVYSDLVAKCQGVTPPALCVALGDGTVETLQAQEVIHYVRHAMRRLMERQVSQRTSPLVINPCGDI